MILGYFLAILIGVSLGLLGGGGSILTVPILLYAMHMEPHKAIASSLLVVGVTSAVGMLQHARRGNVAWRTGLLFSVGGMSGAYVGGRVGTMIPANILLFAFAGMMGVTAVMMLRKKRGVERTPGNGPLPLLLGQGFAVGLFTGTIGAGGGFLVVPALVLLAGLPMHLAVGTSLLVIFLNTSAGLAGYLSEVHLDWMVAGMVSVMSVGGSFIGSHFASKVPADKLRGLFAWFIVAMAVLIVSRETGLLTF